MKKIIILVAVVVMVIGIGVKEKTMSLADGGNTGLPTQHTAA